MNKKIKLQKILLWGIPFLIAGLIIPSIYFGRLATKGWMTYPEITGENSLTIDELGRIWNVNGYPYCGGGVGLFIDGHWKTFTVAAPDLPDHCVNSIAFDEKGRIWIGTRTTITIYEGNDSNPLEKGTKVPDNSFFDDLNPIDTIAFDKEGSAWVASWQGLSIFDGKEWKNFDQSDFEILGPDWNSVLNIAFDQQGKLWVRTSRGITVIEGENWTTYKETRDSGKQNMSFDNKGRVWVSDCEGISIIDGGIQTTYTSEDSNIPNGCISTIDFDQQGRAWVLFNLANSQQSELVIFDEKNWTSVLKNEDISCRPTFDKQGRTWVCAQKGIRVYNNGNWTNYTTSNSGLSDNNVNNIVFDKQGQAWITTRNELSVATPDEFVSVPPFFVAPVDKLYIPGFLVLIWITINPIIDPVKRKLINKLKESTTSKSERFRLGFLSGGILSFLSLALIPSIAYGIFITSPFILIQALILGVLSGIGGLIIGYFWQKKIGAVVGGLIAVIVSSPLLFWFSSCVFLGGC